MFQSKKRLQQIKKLKETLNKEKQEILEQKQNQSIYHMYMTVF